MNPTEQKIEKKDFEFVNVGASHDVKLSTKPVGYYRDAWRRFKKNKASVVAACIIILLVLFSLIVPFAAPFPLNYLDGKYTNMLPKSNVLSKIGIATGLKKADVNTRRYYRMLAIGAGAEDYDGNKYNHVSVEAAQRKNVGNTAKEDGIGTKYAAITNEPTVEKVDGNDVYFFTLDTYMEVGFAILTVTTDELKNIEAFENETGLKIIYPTLNPSVLNANQWYVVNTSNDPVLDAQGNFISNYLLDQNGDVVYYDVTESGNARLRVLWHNYFIYKNGKEPVFFLGTNSLGQDLLIRLAIGIRTSLILSLVITSVNLIIGAIYGAVAGYYGGRVDMIMERIREILNGMPFIIIVMLFKLHLVDTGKVGALTAIIFSFVTLGWIGMAGLVRRQFYRFKHQEYVLAARTLGAKDLRIMSKHIFPNGIGTIITSSVLAIPGFIFGESSLAYLGILDISGRNAASLGAMLASGQTALSTYPHIILWPAIVISLLMLSFNLFGNGLRDAFNPTLRGTEG